MKASLVRSARIIPESGASERHAESAAEGEGEGGRQHEEEDEPVDAPAEDGDVALRVPEGDRGDWGALGQRILGVIQQLVHEPRLVTDGRAATDLRRDLDRLRVALLADPQRESVVTPLV